MVSTQVDAEYFPGRRERLHPNLVERRSLRVDGIEGVAEVVHAAVQIVKRIVKLLLRHHRQYRKDYDGYH